MKLSKKQITEYASKYEEKFSDDIKLENKLLDWFKNHQFMDKERFVQLGRWKTKRQTKNYLRNSDEDVRKVINESLTSVDEEKRIEILMKLRGVSWAVASVILHFAFPNKYTILDFRALWSLDKVRPKSYGFRFWIEYVLEFRNLVQETGLYGRTIDRGLWMYSKLHQKSAD